MARRALGVTLLTAAAFVLRLYATWTDRPLGTDGYYYVVQIEDWVAHGRLHVPDSSWVLRLLAVPHLLGQDAIGSLAMGASLLAAAVVPCAWALGWRRSPAHAWGLAALAAGSPTLTHLAADFPKNLGVVAPLVGLVAAWAYGRDGARWAWLTALACALLAATAHRLGAVFVLLAVLASLTERLPRRAWLGLGGAAVAFAVASSQLPSLLHPADLHRLQGQLRATPWPLAPWSFTPLRPTYAVQVAELAASWVAALAVPWAWRIDRPVAAVGACWLAVALFPWWSYDALDVGYRCHLLAPLGLWAVLAATPTAKLPRWGPWAVASALAWVPAALWGFDPASRPPYDRYDALVDAIPRPLPDLVIAHQGINFLYDHRTGQEAMAWAPEPHLDRQQIGRVAWGIRPGEWAAVLRPEHPAIVPLGGRYHYVREDVWEALVREATSSDDDGLRQRIADDHNPHRVRPAALTRGR